MFKKFLIGFVLVFGINTTFAVSDNMVWIQSDLNSLKSRLETPKKIYNDECDTTLRKLVRKTNTCFKTMCDRVEDSIKTSNTYIWYTQKAIDDNYILQDIQDNYLNALNSVTKAESDANLVDYNSCKTTTSYAWGVSKSNTTSSNTTSSNTTKLWSNAKAPLVNCYWLPGCVDKQIDRPSPASVKHNLWAKKINALIWNLINYVAVFAVIALILSGIMYLISWGEEEKVKKAKTWITWSLVWVILSVSAWGIINMLNNIVI